ncbi:MAG: TetR/AcrR family transcriptional regulator [Tissierellia bacterium]|nr:TetR/AcrR family transcriptional regulator [Tissierellia bacterium]
MVSKVELNKKEKENSLFQAGYDLFTTKGIHDTAINDIVKKAGVAKGTFYLYFQDKYDLLDRIVLNKSAHVLCEAIRYNGTIEFESFEEEVLNFVNYIIEYFKEDKLLLKLIYKNLSWGTFQRAYKDYEEIQKIYIMFENGYEGRDLSQRDIENLLFIIIELIGSVCYSSIILEEPSNIDEIKPILFDTIRKII